MATIENVLYLPDPQSFADMQSGDMVRTRRARKAMDRGSISTEGGALRFQGAKGTVELSPVRGVTHDRWAKVEYGTGADIRTGYFSVPSKIAGKKNRLLVQSLQQALGLTEAAPGQDVELDRHRSQVRAATARRSLIQMWIGGAVAVIGILVTVITLSAASGSSGGRYIVAWGAILFGGLAFVQGLVEWRRNRGG
ncbi:MAG TPA: hypothetical protein VEO00_08005 [Actinomycetota bacterium]|nr:hypothetical protein [Actinomycetota bacterium]